MKYCSNCGSSNLEFKIPEGDHYKRYCCKDCETIFYTNPNMIVGALCIRDEKILMAKRNIHPKFPGAILKTSIPRKVRCRLGISTVLTCYFWWSLVLGLFEDWRSLTWHSTLLDSKIRSLGTSLERLLFHPKYMKHKTK